MNPRTLAAGIEQLRSLLADLQASSGDPARPRLDGTRVRALFAGGIELISLLRGHLADSADPRLALELATAAQLAGAEATRLCLVAAERVGATAANTLAQEELDALRVAPADTTREPLRATGRPAYKDPAELLASWTRTPYAQTSRQVLDAQDLVARRDISGAPLPPRFRHLGDQFFNPAHNPQDVRQISQKLARVEPVDTSFEGLACEPTLRHSDGRTLEEHAAEALDTEFTGAAAAKKVGTLIHRAADDPATATRASMRRGLFTLPERNQYYREYLLRVSTLEAGLIDSLVAQANNPRTQAGKAARVNPTPDGSGPGSAGVPGNGWSAQPAGEGKDPAPQEVPDFLPDGAEAARWDDPDPLTCEATRPERALNSLLDLLEFEPDEPADGVAGQGTGHEQDALFEPYPPEEPGWTDQPAADNGPAGPVGITAAAGTGMPEPATQAGCPERTGEYIEQLTARGDLTRLGNRRQRRAKRIRPLLVAHMYIENLQDIAAAHAQTRHGVDLPAAALRQLLCRADLIPAVFNVDGALLDFGRRLRLVPDILQKAVLARDRACIVPGCTSPVEHLEFHHVIPFSAGGATKLENIVPACRTHHIEMDLGLIRVHFRRGLPWVLLPRDRDPDQRLRRNHVPPGTPPNLPLLEPL